MFVALRKGCFYRLKITKLKAIHNNDDELVEKVAAVFIDSKLQN